MLALSGWVLGWWRILQRSSLVGGKVRIGSFVGGLDPFLVTRNTITFLFGQHFQIRSNLLWKISPHWKWSLQSWLLSKTLINIFLKVSKSGSDKSIFKDISRLGTCKPEYIRHTLVQMTFLISHDSANQRKAILQKFWVTGAILCNWCRVT